MAKGIRTCIICGKTYKYCPNCGYGSKDETWRYIYDSEMCNKIFDILSAFENKHIKKDEAKRQLEELNIPKDTEFKADIKKQIDAIMGAENKAKTKPQIVNED